MHRGQSVFFPEKVASWARTRGNRKKKCRNNKFARIRVFGVFPRPSHGPNAERDFGESREARWDEKQDEKLFSAPGAESPGIPGQGRGNVPVPR